MEMEKMKKTEILCVAVPGRSMVETISGCSSASIMQRWKVLLMDDCR